MDFQQASRESEILDAVTTALARCSEAAASIFIPPKNTRACSCSVEGCDRPAYANAYCNAHYMRSRAGREMHKPVRARKRDDLCSECQAATGAKGGWGLCQKHYRARRYAAIKDAVIATLGGRCQTCSDVFPRAVFDFHHRSGKTDHPSALISNRAPVEIAKELAQCDLLCANCHRMEHSDGL